MFHLRTLLLLLNATLLANAHYVRSKGSKKSKKSKKRSKEHDREWQEIYPESFDYTNPGGETRTYNPSCSGGPIVDLNTGSMTPGNLQFSFFFKPGKKSKKLLFFLQGGGVCFDGDTCIGSAFQRFSAYSREVMPESYTERETGIFNDTNSDNPYRDYTKIFVPYCSGDLFLGSKDTKYTFQNDRLGPTPIPWTISHRGADNFLSALHWAMTSGHDEYGFDIHKVHDLSIVGSSAGSYSVLPVAFPNLAELVSPRCEINLVLDGVAGVLTPTTFSRVFYDSKDPTNRLVYDALANLSPWAGVDRALIAKIAEDPESLLFTIAKHLSMNYKPSQLSMSLVNYDRTQVRFYGFQLGLDGIVLPNDVLEKERYDKALVLVGKLETLSNYRVHMEETLSNGAEHITLTSPFFYNTSGTTGVPVYKWIECMIHQDEHCWVNVKVLL